MKILQNRWLENKFSQLPIILLTFFLFLLCHSSLFAQTNNTRKVFGEISGRYSLPFQNCWSQVTNQEISNIVASDNDNSIYITTFNSELISINSSGKIHWKNDLGGQIVSTLFVDEENIFLVTKTLPVRDKTNDSEERVSQHKNTLRSVNRNTGVTNWLTRIFDSEKIYSYGFRGNIILIGHEGAIKCVKTINGEVVWETVLDSKLSAQPFPTREQVLVGTQDGHIIQLSLNNGRQISKLKTASIPTAVLANQENQNLFWGDEKGSVFSVKNADSIKSSKKYKTRWQFRNGAKIPYLSLTSAGLLVSSYDNFIYLIRQEDGEIVWKKRFAGRISAEPFIVDEFALVTTLSEPYVSIVEMSSGKTINKILLEETNAFTSNPVEIGWQIIFPTLKGIISFSADGCSGA